MTPINHPGKFVPSASRSRTTVIQQPQGTQSSRVPESAKVAPSHPQTAPVMTGSRWSPKAATAPLSPPPSRPVTAARLPRSLASIELFQKAQALLLALPSQPPVLRKEGVELIAGLGAGYVNGDAASLISALNETRARCGRLLALLTALCPAQLGEFEMQLHGLHRACGFFIRYLQEQQRGEKR